MYNILEGEELALICKGGGGVVWRRKDGLMPNGQPYIAGGQVIIERVGREDGGEYQCWDTTHNYRGKVVNVVYPPSVSVHKLYLSHHSSITLELVCEVEANPYTYPEWVRLDEDGIVRNISTEENNSTWVVKRGLESERFSVVVIHSPQDQHLGEYVCSAGNRYGQDQQSIVLEGEDLTRI